MNYEKKPKKTFNTGNENEIHNLLVDILAQLEIIAKK